MKDKEKMLLIVDDCLSELYGDQSNRDKTEWNQNEYLEVQLMKLFDLLKGTYIDDGSLEQLQQHRNQLNRKISSLKKASLKV